MVITRNAIAVLCSTIKDRPFLISWEHQEKGQKLGASYADDMPQDFWRYDGPPDLVRWFNWCLANDEEESIARQDSPFCNNANAAVRRRIWEQLAYDEELTALEDIDWAKRVILAGYKLVFEPRSRVIHSHNNSAWYELKRIYCDHYNLHDSLGVHTIPTWDVLKECVRDRMAAEYLGLLAHNKT